MSHSYIYLSSTYAFRMQLHAPSLKTFRKETSTVMDWSQASIYRTLPQVQPKPHIHLHTVLHTVLHTAATTTIRALLRPRPTPLHLHIR